MHKNFDANLNGGKCQIINSYFFHSIFEPIGPTKVYIGKTMLYILGSRGPSWTNKKIENTYHGGKNHCTADSLFDWFGFDRTSKTVVNATYRSKAAEFNKINGGQPYKDHFP